MTTSIHASTAFLYTGTGAVQQGVDPATISPARAAVLSGRVTAPGGEPLPGVTVTVLEHPEYGRTTTRADGEYDLAVNDGPMTVTLSKPGHLDAQRAVHPRPNDHFRVGDVVLVPLDPNRTQIDLSGGSTELQVAAGSVVTDESGTRQAVSMFAPGTTATMTLPDGRIVPTTSGGVRITEFTVGPDGPAAMPGELPPATAYTYAAEWSLDEALEAGATRVDFSKPVVSYVDDFLGFGAGMVVPVGYYDRTTSSWVAGENGRVVQVLGATDGLADLDTDGDGAADGLMQLGALGVTDDERRELARRYDGGTVLWRVSFDHFTPWDCNWPYAPADDEFPAKPNPSLPEASDTSPRPEDEDCDRPGSIIGCRNQSLGEVLPIAGTRLALRYDSRRTPGGSRVSLDVPLTGGSVPSDLRSIRLVVTVAGRSVADVTLPASELAPHLVRTVVWDGRDRYGREYYGAATADVRVDYVYSVPIRMQRVDWQAFGGVWNRAFARFATEGMVSFEAVRGTTTGRVLVRRSQSYSLPVVSRPLPPVAQLGAGWGVDAQHHYDPGNRTVYRGDGGRFSATGAAASVFAPVAGAPAPGTGDGSPASTARLQAATSVATGPDGSVYVVDQHRIRRIDLDGRISTVAGTGAAGYSGDGGPAVAAQLQAPEDLVVAPDGTLYIADTGNHVLRRVRPDGTIETWAGTTWTEAPDRATMRTSGPASEARFRSPQRLTLLSDGSVVVVDDGLLRRIGTDRFVTAVPLGYGEQDAWIGVEDVSAAPDGSLYYVYSSEGGPGLSRLTDGTSSRLLSYRGYFDRVAVERDGSLLLADHYGVQRRLPDGRMLRVAHSGGVPCSDPGSGDPATQFRLCSIADFAQAPDGSVLLALEPSTSWATGQPVEVTPARVVRAGPALPGYAAEGTLIGSPDGREAYLFDRHGRHLRTYDALTGGVRRTFDYDGAGRLAAVVDLGQRLELRRADSTVTLVAEGGPATTLTVAGGVLTSVEDPVGGATTMTYTGDHLLTTLVEPSGATHRFAYDSTGALTTDTGPSGGTTTLRRSRPTPDTWLIEVTDPAGRTTLYGTRRLADGGIERTVTDPSGARTTQVDGADGRSTVTDADGTTIRVTRRPDPRFGLVSAYVSELTVTPAGAAAPTQTRSESRSVTLASVSDPLSLTTAETVVTTNGRSERTTYSDTPDGGGTLTRTSAAGRSTAVGLDESGRVVRVQQGDLTALTRTFDATGRLLAESRGDEQVAYAYDAAGNPTSRTDALGAATRFSYDAVGRVTSTTRPSGLQVDFGYDADGRLVRVDDAGLTYREDDALAGFSSAAGNAYAFTADAAGERTRTRLPSGASVTLDRAADGRLTSIRQRDAADGEVARTDLSYVGSTGRFAQVQRVEGGTAVQTLDNAFTGSRLTRSAWSGAASGVFDYGYDAGGAVTSRTLTSDADTVTRTFGYDADGLQIAVGAFALTRDDRSGEVTRISDGTGTTELSYDAAGRPTGRSTSVAGTSVFEERLVRDAAHRATSRSLTAAGTTSELRYAYDADGRLTEVRDAAGTVLEAYAWDAAGRRTSRTDARGTAAATHDADGRLLTDGGTAYSWTADGHLAARGSDAFRWSPRGELLQARVGDQTVSYAYDGFGRRVGRTVDGATTQYLYGNLSDVTQLTASRGPDGVLSVYDYDEEQRLIGFRRGSASYYVATDALGSPTVVTDAAGTVVKALTYSAFGVVTSDSAPGFELPVGFASGLTDPVTGLVHFAARDYDPASGLWTARDPGLFDGGQADLYLYAMGDPVNRVDRTGLASIEVGAGVGLYLGIKLGLTSEGFSFCWEGGVGIGAGIGIDPLEGLDADGSSTFQAEIGGDVAGVGMGAKLSRRISKGPCGRSGEVQAEAKACVGIVCGKVNNDGFGANTDIAEVAGLELQAKATLNTCVASQW